MECRKVSARRLLEICKTVNTSIINEVDIIDSDPDATTRGIAHWYTVKIGTQCYAVFDTIYCKSSLGMAIDVLRTHLGIKVNIWRMDSIMNKIYKVINQGWDRDGWFDKFDSFIVIAKDKEEIPNIIQNDYQYINRSDGGWDNDPNTWQYYEIGTTDKEPGAVLGSFNRA